MLLSCLSSHVLAQTRGGESWKKRAAEMEGRRRPFIYPFNSLRGLKAVLIGELCLSSFPFLTSVFGYICAHDGIS